MKNYFKIVFLMGIISLINISYAYAQDNKKSTSSLAYEVVFNIKIGTDAKNEQDKEHKQDKQEEILKLLQSEIQGVSQLVALKDKLPQSKVDLERRVRKDVNIVKQVMQSQAYFNAHVEYNIKHEAKAAQVTFTIDTGQRFYIAQSSLEYIIPQKISPTGYKFLEEAPSSFAGFGLKDGSPATAQSINDALDTIPSWLHENGFPFAKIKEKQFLIYPSNNTFIAKISIDTGLFYLFGPLLIEGNDTAEEAFLQKLIPWSKGKTWHSSELPNYVEELQHTGLFSEIIVEHGDAKEALYNKDDENNNVELPIKVIVKEGKSKQVSGGIKYSSDNGLGISASWLHRNLLGAGERLRFTGVFSEEEQKAMAEFSKPHFLHKNQEFNSAIALTNYSADTYEMQSLGASAGIGRQFSRSWWAGINASIQYGQLNERDHYGWQDFSLAGIPISLRYDSTNDLLNPISGIRWQTTVTPWLGEYRGLLFNVFSSQTEFSTYYAPLSTVQEDGTSKKSDWLVLATRLRLSNIFTDLDVHSIPASLRFYAGGGGSVRGYAYQSLGPSNDSGNPQGGLSMLDVNAEIRFKVTEEIGLVPFIDGGMVYDKTFPDFNEPMRFGAGLGLRYYSPIGPLRLDVAMPLNPEDNRYDVFLYISIGQSF